MWAYESVFYQIFPIGMLGAPRENDDVEADFKVTNRLAKIDEDWLDHFEKLGINAIYFSPIFESDSHGYNTRDYRLIDRRLGTNKDFTDLVKRLHDRGIKVVIDGVFNHVGRGFFAFRDVIKNRENSKYKDWFNINFGGNSEFNDGLWYEGWEGCYDLVKLNLSNEEVINYLLESVKIWVEDFDIDGIRLDVAYLLDRNFLKRLRSYTDGLKADFFLLGEILGGDYKTIMADDMCHSATNYECYKGIHSSLNSMNLFEIIHSLKRQFGPEDWTLYKGRHLLSFIDNHDVTRAASIIQRPEHLKLMFAFIFTMPGIPCIYYGSEWGAKGGKNYGDYELRAAFDKPEFNELTEYIAELAKFKTKSKALNYGDFTDLMITNRQCVFKRSYEGESVFIFINADENPYEFNVAGEHFTLEPFGLRILI
ncbi:alpha-amylase family glycosyl hydrolase [Lachnospira multipara]|uniref:Glycosidase n=1 Tax=Lachnospira multipara TaxID=28051 RepID=A0A1H5VHQ9_9FIRM|nr:alpha-amylase family glycosyl hydrolase [Lachnospira multipara]SEF86331.1 Glycosidase [Lachnospira multipara]